MGRQNRSGSIQVDSKLFARLEWLDEADGGGYHSSSKTMPPNLYIDGETVVEEIKDITCLRKGLFHIKKQNSITFLHFACLLDNLKLNLNLNLNLNLKIAASLSSLSHSATIVIPRR